MQLIPSTSFIVRRDEVPMREATTATALPVDTESDRRTRVLLAIACVMLAGLIYAVVVRDEAVSCPNELIG